MLSYILEFSFFMLIFWGVYELFLKKETFFNYNRLYLLLTPIISAILPLLSFAFLENSVTEALQIVQLSAVIVGDPIEETTIKTAHKRLNPSTGFWEKYGLLLIYFFGVFINALLFFRKTLQFQQLKSAGNRTRKGNIHLVDVPNSKIACTFFKTIYLGEDLAEDEKEQIFKHEQIHAQHYHTLDLLFFEIMKILVWFNPIVYFYQKQIINLHEYIADAAATKNSDKIKYYESLLKLAFGSHRITFINQFFNHSLIKKRILMLQKSKSAKSAKFKFFILIPVILGMLTYVSCNDNAIEEIPNPRNINNAHDKILEEEVYTVTEVRKIDVHDVNNLTVEEKEKIAEIFQWALESGKTINVIIKDANQERSVTVNSESDEIPLPPTPPNPPSAEVVPFTAIETIPIYPGCENLDDDAAKHCMSNKIKDFVNTNFNSKEIEAFANNGINRIYVRFAINKNGEIDQIEARNPIPELVAEAERVVSLLPTMKPGKMEGKPVNVLYSLPIIFKIDE